MDDAPIDHAAAIQARFREANERIRESAQRYRFDHAQRVPFLCECDDPGCFETVMLSLVAYATVRDHPRRFLLAAGHEDTERERVIEAERGYAVVERLGVAAGLGQTHRSGEENQ